MKNKYYGKMALIIVIAILSLATALTVLCSCGKESNQTTSPQTTAQTDESGNQITSALTTPALTDESGNQTTSTRAEPDNTSTPVTQPAVTTEPITEGNGLWAEYFNGKELNTFVCAEKISQIDFNFQTGKSPAAGVAKTNYSVAVYGRIKSDVSGEFKITTDADDGVKITIDGKEIINDAGPHYPEAHSGIFTFEAGKYYNINVVYYNGDLGGCLALSWEGEKVEKQIIPETNLFMPEYPTDISFSYNDTSEIVKAHMMCESNEKYILYVEKRQSDGTLIDTFTKERTENNIYWEITDMTDKNENMNYTAYIKDGNGNVVSYVSTKYHSQDYAVVIDAANKTGEVSKLLYGACMEDVNHELYGGIWSQMIFGEAFEEPFTGNADDDFKTAGGRWYLGTEGAENLLCIDNTSNGPKLIINSSECTTGTISADIYVDGEGAGFIVKTSNATAGADNFDGYEVSFFENKLRIGKHLHNYTLISDTVCTAPLRTWINLKVSVTANTITVFVNGEQIVSYTETAPIAKGSFGFRAWNAAAKYKNIKMTLDGDAEKEVSLEGLEKSSVCAGMWESVITGTATGSTSVITSGVYSGKQSQRLEFGDGIGSIGINNMGLNRSGMNFVAEKDYNGYIYAKSNSPLNVTVAFESADHSVRYAEKTFIVSSSEWTKYSFSLVPSQSDTKGAFVIEIHSAGTLDLGYVFLEPGEWGLYKGLHVRKDVGELLENQGITVLRFGGCMANAAGFKWKEMTGTPESRNIYDGWWYDWSSYGFGIIEFLDLCEALGVEAVPDFNSYETPQDMVDFVKFALGTDSNDEWVKLRIAMGHPEPYKLKYIEIGNEEAVNADYAKRFNAIANAIWEIDNSLILVVGDFDYKDIITDPYNFPMTSGKVTSLINHKTILDNAVKHNRPVWFDIHFWSERGTEPYNFINVAASLYDALGTICPDADFKLCVFELNANTHTFERGLCNALAINSAERMSDIFKIICSANALQVDKNNDNGWDQGLLFMNSSSAWYQPAAYVDRVFKDAYLPYTVAFSSDESVNNSLFDVTVTSSEDGKTVCVKILNRTGSEKGILLDIPLFAEKGADMKTVSYSGAKTDVNTAENPEKSKPSAAVITENALNGGKILVGVDEYSLTAITFTAK